MLGGAMWLPACQAAADPLPSHIPINFDSPQHYIATFEPLLHEEARSAARAAFQEAGNSGRGWPVQVVRCVAGPVLGCAGVIGVGT